MSCSAAEEGYVPDYDKENMLQGKLTVDLHPIFRSDRDIDAAVRGVIFRAVGEKVPLVEIIPGKGSGKLKKRVLALLGQPHLKKLYRRVEVLPGNDGLVMVHMR